VNSRACYACITEMLTKILSARAAAEANSQELAQRLESAITKVLASEDQLAHVALFEWYLLGGLSDKLVQVYLMKMIDCFNKIK
jgi:hypothetical protein